MMITITLADADGGTNVLAVHDGLPRGVPTADNEEGWREALATLAALVEAGYRGHSERETIVCSGFGSLDQQGKRLLLRR